MKKYEYDAVIHLDPESGGAYVPFPWDIRQEFGKGRIRVHAEFGGMPYDGSICYVIGILRRIRLALGKADGDCVHVVITPDSDSGKR